MAIHAGENNGCGCDDDNSSPGIGTQNNVLKNISYTVNTSDSAPPSVAAVAALINANGFTVSEIETPVVITVTALGTDPQAKHIYFFTAGAGTYGSAATVVVASNVIYICTQGSAGESTGGGNTMVINLGAVSGNNYLAAINLSGRDLSDTDCEYFFTYRTNGDGLLLQFIGTNGYYGGAYPDDVVEADLQLIGSLPDEAATALGYNAGTGDLQLKNSNGTVISTLNITATDAETQTNTTPVAGKFIDTLRLFNFTLSEVFKGRVRAVLLAGLSTATATDITTADTIIGAFGKLQAQLFNKIQSGFESTSVVKFISLVTSVPSTQAANTLYLTETNFYRGTITVSSPSSATVSIPHGLGAVPSYFDLQARNANAAGLTYRYADATNIYGVFTTQPSGALDFLIVYEK